MIQIEPGDPKSAEARALLEASHALMQSLFPAEANHFLSIDALCAPEITLYLARLDDGLAVGCIALAEKDGYGEVKSFYVAEEARGNGIGAALLEHVETAAKTKGIRDLKLETGNSLRSAHKLYRAQGYQNCHAFGDYVPSEYSIFMEKTL